MAEPAFRGTLLLLQNRTRRDPESYKEEFLSQLEHFRATSATVLSQRTVNPQYVAVLNYVCHVAHCFPSESTVTVNIVLELLRAAKGGSMPQELRLALVKSLMLLRSKDLVSTDETFPLFFQLLQERDKTLRKLILTHVVSDIRKVNMPGAKNGTQVNKKAQNFLFSVMDDDDAVQARCAEMVMIDLYRRRVWCDERTVEVLTRACFSKHTPILRTALRFFLLQMPKITSVDDEADDDDESQDPGRAISKMKQKLKIVKKTSKRERILSRDMRSVKRKYNKQEREEELFAKQHVDPIRLLRDPQQFVERLLAKLQKTSERFEVRLLYLNVIARTVSEHEVIHVPLYAFLERYMEPSQLHSTQLLALSSMCVHRMIPPDAVETLLKAIANHFVSDRSTPDAITVGINTIREMCKRQPLAMNEDLLKDLVEYKNQRGDKGVMMAARALIQLYREVYPELLPAKLRGSRAGAADTSQKPQYGMEEVMTDIPGLDLLYQSIQEDGEGDEASSKGLGSSSDEEDSDSDSSGEWVTDSDSELAASDVEGDFIDATDSDEEEEGVDGDDECPLLVPVKTLREDKESANEDATPAKRVRLEGDATQEDGSIVLDDGTDEKKENEEEDSDVDMSDAADDEEDVASEEAEDDDDDEESEGGWEEVSDGDGDLSFSDDDEYDDDDDFEEEEEEEEPKSMAAALAKAGSSEWFVDVEGKDGDDASSVGGRTAPSETSTKASSTASSVSANRILTDADFAKIRLLQAQHGSHKSLRGKLKDRDARNKKRQDLVLGISDDLSAHDIEHFTESKRESDKADKIEKAQELRKARSKFEMQRKKKSKLNSTHGEHSKRGKLFQMTKRSQRVSSKLKSSVSDRQKRAKDMKKKDIKFRINRGWKA